MQPEKSEGIVLKSHEYKERERILSIYTLDAGLISVIVKGISRKRPDLLAATTPFCIADFCYLKGRSDLFRFQDADIKKNLRELRSSLAHIKAAAEMTRAILHSQMPEKRAPALYALLKAYLVNLPQFPSPEAILASFYLKILLHEGLLSPRHPPSIFKNEEWEELLPLMAAKQFEALKPISVSTQLLSKVKHYFCSSVNR